MATWLVTGANGFLGANAGIFLESRATAVGLTRSGAAPRYFSAAIHGDLGDPEPLCETIRDLRPDVILHAAALASHEGCESDPGLARRINADATGALARTADEIGARFVYVSTDAVFDGRRGHYIETDEPSPFSVYGETKLLGEQYALAAADALVVRTNFFGWSPSGRRSILEFFVNDLGAGRGVSGYTDFIVTSAYVTHLLDAVWRLVAADASGIVHVASADALSKFAFGRAVAEVFGLDATLITPVSADAVGLGTSRARDISLSTALLGDLLGEPVPTQRMGIVQAYEDARTLRAAIQEGGANA